MNESKEKFTPGPWRVLGRGVYTGDENANIVADTFYADANAAIIAAAPEMYAELEKVACLLRTAAMFIEKQYGYCPIVAWMRHEAYCIDALLAKARGEVAP